MKRILIIISIIWSITGWTSVIKKISVKGMVCSFCAHGIEKKFSKEDRVESVKVDLEKAKVFLKVKDNLSDEEIIKIIKESGYEVESID